MSIILNDVDYRLEEVCIVELNHVVNFLLRLGSDIVILHCQSSEDDSLEVVHIYNYDLKRLTYNSANYNIIESSLLIHTTL